MLSRKYFFILGIGLLMVVVFVIQGSISKGSASLQKLANRDFQFLSSESSVEHPVFVSQRFHFRYTPTGNYRYSVDGPREKMLKGIYVTNDEQPGVTQGLSLLIYETDDVAAAHDVARFRNWRKENIYDDEKDVITAVTLSGFTLWKATQVDGINSSSAYYYLVQPDYTYVFLTGLENPDEAITGVLANFSLS